MPYFELVFLPDYKLDYKPYFMPHFKSDCQRDFQVTIDEDLIRKMDTSRETLSDTVS